ncbi:hypothetical protein IFT73_15675 [Aeromicrobium sp. CFBP 8757]|uniref:hypothetical protein n=1 Tax=Aeromicrobium sp. CFBP 8757 TaxID=2775288 RepID=UPI0017822F22|nr:hypothetical protein [Aeromicrobium sp. CFBP 8757]MBD8608297.1 hypothetical protein [Aeromicrobium sp. CFBP 8757]
MTLESSSDFDAGRVGRRDRRRAVRLIGAARGITDADRELRIRDARTAQTRGELHALTRGLDAMPVAVAGRPSTPAVPNAPPAASAQRRRFGGKVVIGLIAVVLVLGTSVVSCLSGLADTSTESSTRSSSGSAPVTVTDLTTRADWDEMVDALDDEADLDRTVLLFADRRSATLQIAESDTSSARYLYDGDVAPASSVLRLPSEQAFDLRDVDAEVVMRALVRARRSSGVADTSEAQVLLTRGRRGPQVFVSFPDGSAGTYGLLVDARGDVISELG